MGRHAIVTRTEPDTNTRSNQEAGSHLECPHHGTVLRKVGDWISAPTGDYCRIQCPHCDFAKYMLNDGVVRESQRRNVQATSSTAKA